MSKFASARRVVAAGATLVGIAAQMGVAAASGESERAKRSEIRDRTVAYAVAIDRGDCGRVLDCFDDRVRIANVRTRRATTIGDCPSSDCNDSSPAWSPDGRTLIFNRNQSAGSSTIAATPKGTGLREVRPGGEPTFAPSGRRLAYEGAFSSRGGIDRALFVGSLDASGQTRRRTRRDGQQASWSSRGRIAFSRLRRNATYDIFTIDPDRGRATRL